MFKEYCQFDGIGLGELLNKGEVTASELLDAAIDKANNLNPKLNAIIHRFDKRAKNQIDKGLPDGIFKGVPFLLKDLTAILEGEKMTMGSRGISWVPDYDSEHVKRIKQSGVLIFGKTNTPEFGLTITTEPKAHGPTHNPHKQDYSTGGSSGGSACAVAAGIVPMAGAGDGGGSIRFPSAWCGVFGLKPSRGLNPLGPDIGQEWSGAVADHIITRTVRDSAAMLDYTAGSEVGSPYKITKDKTAYLNATLSDPKPLKIALSQKPLIENTKVEREVLEALYQTAKQLESLGHIVEEVEPNIAIERFWSDFFLVVCSHVAANENAMRRRFGKQAISQFEASTKNMAQLGRALRADELLYALEGWHLHSRAMGELLTQYDLMLCPTVPTTAVPHGELPASKKDELLMDLSGKFSAFGTGKLALKSGMVQQLAHPVLSKMAFTILGNITGLPAMSVPLHTSSKGLPIGMQFYGNMCEEAKLFSLASQLERAAFFKSKLAL